MNDIDFTYAAGKITNFVAGTTFIAETVAPATRLPSLVLTVKQDGTYTVKRIDGTTTATGVTSTYNWYTGGVPVGPTTFNAVVTYLQTPSAQSSGTTAGTYNVTTDLVINAACTSLTIGTQRRIQIALTITRNGQSRSDTFNLEASSTG